MLTRFQHSLSAKLLAVFICAGAILLLLVGSIMGKGFSQHFRSGVEPFMIHYIELMQHELGSPPSQENAIRITEDTPVDIHVFGDNEQWSTADRLLDPAELESQGLEENADAAGYQFHRSGQNYLLETRDGSYQIYFEISNPENLKPGTRYSLIILALIFIVLILIYFVTRAIFRPIQDIDKGIQKFGDGELSYRISKHRNDQLGDLTDSINQMADDISQMLEAKRQFLLGISHELRSPLTRCKVNLALIEDSATKAEVNRDIEAMDNLIDELLESERLNSPHRVINPEETRFDQLVNELVGNEFSDRKVELRLEPIVSAVDPARIRLLVRNLLQNAIKYSHTPGKPAQSPVITLKRAKNEFHLSVQDFGQGVAREHIPFLTEPFYRADPSRQRQTGGYGLGLYLCSMIMRAHSGQLNIQSKIGEGTTIICRFPFN